MINWETLGAMAVTLTALGALFLWAVKAIVENAIHVEVSGMRTDIELLKQKQNEYQKHFDALHAYTHTEWHDQVNDMMKSFMEVLQSFKARRGE